MNRFKGIFPAMVTPYGADGSVNYGVVGKLVERFASERLDGVYITGSTGEFPLLTKEERKAITRTVCAAAAKRIKVIVHVGSSCLRDAAELAECAAENGADAISSVPPYYFKYTFPEIKAYYSELASVTELPFIIYNVPCYTNVSLSIDDVKELSEIKNIVGMKHTSTDMYILERVKTKLPDFTVFSGPDEMCLSAHAAGSDGAIGTTYNFMGRRFKRILAYYDAHETERALGEQRKANAVIEALLKVGVNQGAKYILKKQGINCGICRSPMHRLKTEDEVYLDGIIRDYLSE